MKNKTRYINAVKKLIKKYRNPKNERFFETETCPLCQLRKIKNKCFPCIMSNKFGGRGCSLNKTYDLAVEFDLFGVRADFWERALPILESTPESRFTKKGWRKWNELFELDKQVYEEYMENKNE